MAQNISIIYLSNSTSSKFYLLKLLKVFSMSQSNKKHSAHNPFTNQRTIQLPSNLLTVKRDKKNHSALKKNLRQTMYLDSRFTPTNYQQQKSNFIQQKSIKRKKQVLYKRLSNIRVDNQELIGLSFSKLLSRMVILDEDKQQRLNDELDDPKYRTLSQVKCLKQKLYNLDCKQKQKSPQQNRKTFSRSIDIDDSQPSRKLFKRYYMPNSQVRNVNFFKTMSPQSKYIWKQGNKVQCKRIHNFYTSNMFMKGYDRFFRKTHDGFQIMKMN